MINRTNTTEAPTIAAMAGKPGPVRKPLQRISRLIRSSFILTTILFCLPARTACARPLQIEIVPRSPEQMSAFYEARGFPANMIDLLAETCYMTVRIKNTSQDVVWLDLSQWKFTAGEKPLHRYHRNEWLQRWQAMDVPLRFQSTFRWTLLPEILDYQPGEEEGGNIILVRTRLPVTLEATFPTGQHKQGKPYRLTLGNLRCAENTQ